MASVAQAYVADRSRVESGGEDALTADTVLTHRLSLHGFERTRVTTAGGPQRPTGHD